MEMKTIRYKIMAGKRKMARVLAVGACLLAVGCATAPKPAPLPEMKDGLTSATARTPSVDPAGHNGSLWSDGSPLMEMFMNYKARKVGDIVTVNIVESSSATNDATTDTGRKTGMKAQIDKFFNMQYRFPTLDSTTPAMADPFDLTDYPYLNPFAALSASMDNSFAGSGKTSRTGALTATISARVVSVLPNGNLSISGSREITVNNDTQIITLSGIVRPADIDENNTILSIYISDATIAYSGRGVIDDRQRPGWMTRLFDVVWPF